MLVVDPWLKDFWLYIDGEKVGELKSIENVTEFGWPTSVIIANKLAVTLDAQVPIRSGEDRVVAVEYPDGRRQECQASIGEVAPDERTSNISFIMTVGSDVTMVLSGRLGMERIRIKKHTPVGRLADQYSQRPLPPH